ncbi:HlyD family secretion protein [Pseudomonas veronii]|uniref:HlyD family secretion protein n=1 Tax=Pseudomonas veronii TaxID=76761 RepID=UPI002D7A04E3|nr:HlyD family secretion protein [Pseudomonas veronii]WRU61158.1 HlyD family secretion protein [Pseudomonas veronii]
MLAIRTLKILLTALLGIVALTLALSVWRDYILAPWTRDGRVSAHVIRIAPEVSGNIDRVFAVDNQQVKRGNLLYQINSENYQLTLKLRLAELARARELLNQRKEEFRRREKLGGAISTEEVENAKQTMLVASATVQVAESAAAKARLDVDRCEIRSPVDGYVTQLRIQPGDHASEGDTNIYIVDQNSFWITGYFEETKLRNIHIGDSTAIKLMGYDQDLRGRIQSIGHGIADLNEARSASGLPQVSPTLSWIRLAQRVPVRIELESIPDEVTLAAGMTGSIEVVTNEAVKHWRLTHWLQEYF